MFYPPMYPQFYNQHNLQQFFQSFPQHFQHQAHQTQSPMNPRAFSDTPDVLTRFLMNPMNSQEKKVDSKFEQ
ncbi:hypothetical protein HI914_04899 [Erysiphe necator]|nr:hypothetical protein HI914_04899 [Erysiphe necator]